MPPLLLNQPPAPEERAHQVRFGLGAGVEPQLHAAFEERFGFPLVEVWGMTETGRIYADRHEPRQITRARSAGRSAASRRAWSTTTTARCRAAARASCSCAGAGRRARGTASSRAISRTPRRRRRRGAAAGSTPATPCARTPTACSYFVDRKKNIIRRSGENIAAAEVEAVSAGARGGGAGRGARGARRAARGGSHGVRGADAGRGAGRARWPAELMDWCLARLAYFKAPGWILFVERLPTTGTQKVQKTQIFPRGEDPRRRARRPRPPRRGRSGPHPGRSSAYRSSMPRPTARSWAVLSAKPGAPLPLTRRSAPARASTRADLGVTGDDREHEGAEIEFRRHVQIRSALHEDLDHLAVSAVSRQHEGGLSVAIPGVDLSAGAQQCPHRRDVAPGDRAFPGFFHGSDLASPLQPRLLRGQEPGHLVEGPGLGDLPRRFAVVDASAEPRVRSRPREAA